MNRILSKLWLALNLSRDAQVFVMRLIQDKFLIGTTGIIFNEKNQILLLKHTYRESQWGLPGGYLKAKEHPIVGLEREIEEESGFVVSVEKRLDIKIDKETSRLDICYLGSFIGGDFKPSSEASDYGLFSLDSMPLLPKHQFGLIYKALKFKQRPKLLDNTVESIEKQKPVFNSPHYYVNI